MSARDLPLFDLPTWQGCMAYELGGGAEQYRGQRIVRGRGWVAYAPCDACDDVQPSARPVHDDLLATLDAIPADAWESVEVGTVYEPLPALDDHWTVAYLGVPFVVVTLAGVLGSLPVAKVDMAICEVSAYGTDGRGAERAKALAIRWDGGRVIVASSSHAPRLALLGEAAQ